MRLSTLAGVACLVVSSQAFAQPGPDDGVGGPAPAPSNDGYSGPRPLLTSLSADQQKTLAGLIDNYTSSNDNAVVKVHLNTMVDPALHNVHEANYAQIFTFHHLYIGGLEGYLTAQGHPEFVPMPKWIPSQPIPKIFGYHLGKKVIKNFTPKVDWSAFVDSKLSVFSEDVVQSPQDTTPDAQILANILIVPHNDTHNTVDGIMSTMSSPTAPIFWAYHAFIDDIWTEWKKVHANPPKNLTLNAQAPGPRTLQGIVRVDQAGNVFLDTPGQGSFAITDDPWKSLLAGAAGQSVSIQATTDGTNAKVSQIITTNGMKQLTATTPSGDRAGFFAPMDEVRIVGTDGKNLQVRVLGSGATGLIPASSVPLGETVTGGDLHSPRSLDGMDMDSTPSTPGIIKAVDGDSTASPTTATPDGKKP
jgi:hypothetical protein